MSKPSLVMLPGLNNTRAVFEDMIRLLADTVDVTVLEYPPLDTLEAIAADVLARCPEHFNLCAFSFGGYVAAAMLEQAPERIERLAFIGAGPGADKPERRGAREAAIARAQNGEYEAMVKANANAAFHPDSLTDARLMARRDAMVKDYGAERYVAHSRAALERPARYHVLAGLQHEMLMMAGETDNVVPLAEMQRTAAAAPKARVVVVPGAGHLLPMEKPAATVAELKLWLNA
ncbi:MULTISPECIES: alpha/beta fold hydrolase [unclassified Beijerinckia]|uniref:alpha/beta fold hydrolase n=1 Tax=unclassified Beijerinckia TaxID=2638183 RepID=UPI000896C683|nr:MULTISPECIES: alpha/beta fold hydrolase [unclassified Beijerinckia]MDH7794645.1 pimeloyl-ACP methyl ester carboxylesterase [Beijerinckia sp. GAS462]SEB69709.1 Pimeloyl-ACP methyl ester carboxylesterase [Beijerinckia sp. 28-YEA-48]